jgi:anti-anti-sigma factor
MEKGEVFDSTLLKNMINSLIAEGKRNFSIDLSPLDYIYSDAINVILALNRRILDVSGRLSIIGPSPEVRQILERTGLQNILKIFDTEGELLKSSEDIILQTTRYNVADLQQFQQAPPKPKSEFEEFRSEISTAMSTGVAPGETEPERGFRQAPPHYAAPQEPPAQQFTKPAAFKEEEFEAAYKSFETEVTQDSYGPPPQVVRPQAPPQYAEPFTPPPVSPPRQPAQPFKRPEQEFAPVQEPMPTARRRDADYAPPRLEPLQPPPATRRMQQEEEILVKPEAAASKGKAKPAFEEKAGREYADFSREAEEMEPKKRSAMPVIITLLVVVLLGVGGYFGYTMYIKGQQNEPAPSQAVPPPAPAVSQPAPAPEQPPVAEPAPAAPAAAQPAPAVEPAKPAPAVVQETVEKPSKKAPAAKPGKKAAAEPSKKAAKAAMEEEPAMAPPPSSPSGKITITSSPSNATIKADDNIIGTTPFVWKNPSVIGEVTIVVSKAGYKESAKTIEFTGGNKTESFKLEKEEPAPVAKPAPRPAEPEPEPEAAAPPPAPKPAPPPPPPPAAEAPAPAPAASSAGGEPATIFISSLPPVADVYMDGKLIGKTNITKLNVVSGSHSMRFVKGTAEVTQDMNFKPGDNPSRFVSVK